MKKKSRPVLKALVQHYHSGKEDALYKFLPEKEAKLLARLDAGQAKIEELFQPSRILLQLIHYSWLAPALEAMPKQLQGPCLASLPPRLGAKVASLMGYKVPADKPCLAIQDYLLDMLYHEAMNPKVRPRALLPHTEFDHLLEIGKPKLVDLIDYLGIHDLVTTMRHIVDKERVQMIMRSLRPNKRDYLKLCLRAKNPLTTPDINLSDWDGTPKQLEAKLQRRGVARLGKALAGQDPSLCWHITRTLDSGRGKALMRQLSPNALPGVTPFLAGQVNNIIRYMEK
ncbi:MAG: hypothetical protein KDK78_03195 [Chlamydiia bacterium]|nr:hypothetical protein [Chlamydiia bacterium]